MKKYQYMQDVSKTVKREGNIANAYIRKQERSQINNINSHFKKLEKKSKINLK